jgi:hypothetical protein
LVSAKQGSVNLPGSRANTSNRSPRDRRTRASRNATKRDYRLTLNDNDKQRLDLPHAIIHWWLMLGDCTPTKLLLSQEDLSWLLGHWDVRRMLEPDEVFVRRFHRLKPRGSGL